jgi:hypothetical protein
LSSEIIGVIAADVWSVDIDIYGAWPELIVVVVKNVVKTSVSWT